MYMTADATIAVNNIAAGLDAATAAWASGACDTPVGGGEGVKGIRELHFAAQDRCTRWTQPMQCELQCINALVLLARSSSCCRQWGMWSTKMEQNILKSIRRP